MKLPGLTKPIAALLLVLAFDLQPVHAQPWTAADLDTLSGALQSALATRYRVASGDWTFFDVADCLVNRASCLGDNPSSPYGFPELPDPATGTMTAPWYQRKDEAVVVLLETPPPARYFGFTPYLFSRYYPRKGRLNLLASLSDTLNLLKIGTTGSSTAGDRVFGQLAVLVMTADLNQFSRVADTLASLQFPATAVNLLALPVTLPLKMGAGGNADTFTMLMRVALLDNPDALRDYIARRPLRVLRLTPNATRRVRSAPVVGFASEISGISEAVGLKTAVDQLVEDVLSRYGAEYAFAEHAVTYRSTTGHECIAARTTCALDNHDSLLTEDIGAVTVNDLKDFVLIVGVDHHRTGKALYVNHSVYDIVKLAGIAAVTDKDFAGSAVYHAGVSDPQDFRMERYADLYVYVISYDCAGKRYCLSIPAPTAADPVGLTPGTPFKIYGRYYVDPLTGVRPSVDEVYLHRVFQATAR